MNKETKIGMLTGLGVIVLIGVLLSQYFERDNRTQQPAMMKDVGEGYRLTAAAPMGVPRVGTEGNADARWSGGGDGGAPVAYAATGGDAARAPAGPVVGTPVAATPVGRIPEVAADALAGDAAMMGAGDTAAAPGGAVMSAVYVAGDPHRTGAVALPGPVAGGAAAVHPTLAAPAGTQYQIAKGDSLSAIALKFYHSSGKVALGRIVAANPTVLKNENTPLVAGKKLLIPAAPAAAPAPTVAGAASGAHGATAPAHTGLVVRPAGSEGTAHAAAPTTPTPTRIEAPATPAKTYTVVKGDSLSKIAAKFLGSSSKAAQDKIVALNKLKGTGVREGEVLKIPAKM